MGEKIRRWRFATSYGWVTAIGKSGHMVRPVVAACREGAGFGRAPGASVERLIERADRMNQKAELN